MSTFKLMFAGHIKNAEHKTVGGKPMVEVSLCRKNKTKEGDPEQFTWVRVTCWDVKDFQATKMVKGSYISGIGDCILRSYVNKEGVKAQSLEVRCGSFDIDQPDDRQQTDQAPAQRPLKPDHAKAAATDSTSEEPPF